jgi:hypothetical protein
MPCGVLANDNMMLSKLEARVLTPEAVEYAIAEYREQLGTALGALTA